MCLQEISRCRLSHNMVDYHEKESVDFMSAHTMSENFPSNSHKTFGVESFWSRKVKDIQTMMQNQIFKTLQDLKYEVYKRYKAELKGIFGSYARGDAGEDSDIAILVEFRKGATLLDLTGLGYFLEGKLGCRVDVVSQRAVRKELSLNIYRDMVYL